MKVITFATKAGGALKYLEQSFERLSDSKEHTFIKVGWGRSWKGFGDRLIQYRDTLLQQDPNDVCLVVDGYDVLLTGNLSVFERKYIEAGHRKVVFSTEVHDTVSSMRNYIIMGAPVKTETGKVFICAGAYIGFAESLIKMLDKVISTGSCDHRYADDQYLLTRLCRSEPQAYEYDRDSNWFITWAEYNDDAIKKDVLLNKNGTVTYKQQTTSFVLHRQFAADLEETILGLGYTMTQEDIEAVKRDPHYHIKFYKHHIRHRWHIIPRSIKISMFIFLLICFIYLVYYLVQIFLPVKIIASSKRDRGLMEV